MKNTSKKSVKPLVFWTKTRLLQRCREQKLIGYSRLNKRRLQNLVKKNAVKKIQEWWKLIMENRKNCEQVNDTDFVNLEAFTPDNPATFYIFDYRTKTKYGFFAEDLYILIEENRKLSNPYNNVDLSESDLYRLCNILNDLYTGRNASWRKLLERCSNNDLELHTPETPMEIHHRENLMIMYQSVSIKILTDYSNEDFLDYQNWFVSEYMLDFDSTIINLGIIDLYECWDCIVWICNDLFYLMQTNPSKYDILRHLYDYLSRYILRHVLHTADLFSPDEFHR